MPTLTKRLIDATPCPSKGQAFIRDDELPGFALRLTPGRKTFIIEKRLHKRLHRVTIGHYGAYTVEQARQKAHGISRASMSNSFHSASSTSDVRAAVNTVNSIASFTDTLALDARSFKMNSGTS